MLGFSFLSGTAAKILIGLALTLGVVGTTGAIYWSITSKAANEQMLKDRVKELEQVIKEQQTTIKQQQDIIQLSEESIQQLNDDITKIREEFSKIEKILQDPELLKHDRPASEILKKVFEQLSRGTQ